MATTAIADNVHVVNVHVANRTSTASRLTVEHVMAFSTRAVLVITAVFFIAVGFVTLTGPLAVPFTVTMWLCAAAFAGLVAFWEIPVTPRSGS